jgi:hypothetical protein
MKLKSLNFLFKLLLCVVVISKSCLIFGMKIENQEPNVDFANWKPKGEFNFFIFQPLELLALIKKLYGIDVRKEFLEITDKYQELWEKINSAQNLQFSNISVDEKLIDITEKYQKFSIIKEKYQKLIDIKNSGQDFQFSVTTIEERLIDIEKEYQKLIDMKNSDQDFQFSITTIEKELSDMEKEHQKFIDMKNSGQNFQQCENPISIYPYLISLMFSKEVAILRKEMDLLKRKILEAISSPKITIYDLFIKKFGLKKKDNLFSFFANFSFNTKNNGLKLIRSELTSNSFSIPIDRCITKDITYGKERASSSIISEIFFEMLLIFAEYFNFDAWKKRLYEGDKYFADCPLPTVILEINQKNSEACMTGFPYYPQSKLVNFLTKDKETEESPCKFDRFMHKFIPTMMMFNAFVPTLSAACLPPNHAKERWYSGLKFMQGLNGKEFVKNMILNDLEKLFSDQKCPNPDYKQINQCKYSHTEENVCPNIFNNLFRCPFYRMNDSKINYEYFKFVINFLGYNVDSGPYGLRVDLILSYTEIIKKQQEKQQEKTILKILEIENKSYSLKDLKRAFKKYSKKCHPDKNDKKNDNFCTCNGRFYKDKLYALVAPFFEEKKKNFKNQE